MRECGIEARFLQGSIDGEKQPGGDKKIYLADISVATDVGPASTVPGATYKADAGGLQVQDKPMETVVGVTTDAADIDKLKSLGFTVAAKSLKLDLGALLVELNDKGEFFGHDKIEGVATPDDGKTHSSSPTTTTSDWPASPRTHHRWHWSRRRSPMAGRTAASSSSSTPPSFRCTPRRRRCRSRSAESRTKWCATH